MARRAWATALAIGWLEIYALQAEDEWRLLVRKAGNWLAAVGVKAAARQNRRAAGYRFVRQLGRGPRVHT